MSTRLRPQPQKNGTAASSAMSGMNTKANTVYRSARPRGSGSYSGIGVRLAGVSGAAVMGPCLVIGNVVCSSVRSGRAGSARASVATAQPIPT